MLNATGLPCPYSQPVRLEAVTPSGAPKSKVSFGPSIGPASRPVPAREPPRECDWLFVSVPRDTTFAQDAWLVAGCRSRPARSAHNWCPWGDRLKAGSEEETQLRCAVSAHREGRPLGPVSCAGGQPPWRQ
jgi:hypothetical protein